MNWNRFFFWLCLLSLTGPVHAQGLSDQVSRILRDRILPGGEGHAIVCREEMLCGSDILPSLYSHRDFRPVWIAQEGPGEQAFSLVRALERAKKEGLNPQDYHLTQIEALLGRMEEPTTMIPSAAPEELADLDLLLTDAFLLYGSHLSAGLVNPETIQAEWFIKSQRADLVSLLEKALPSGGITEALDRLKPKQRGYRKLREALEKYRRIRDQGGWARIPRGPKMEKRDRGSRVAELRSRLMITGDLYTGGNDSADIFDEELDRAVRRFQKRHGLVTDGIVGPRTLSALNVPVKGRIHQIEVNLERWRWLPRDFGRRYILVNIADFELDVVEDGWVMERMHVVVGKKFRRTPVFSGKITYMEVNPYWHIPPRLAREDVLPHIRKDPSYLAEKKIRVFENWQRGAKELDPQEIDWSRVSRKNFSFKLVQDPGPSNPLGRIKFMFPNRFSVYLHDTPSRDLFLRPRRSFSSGCIRIEKPIALAAYLLGGDPDLARQRILNAMETQERYVIRIPEPIPILILYWTAWVDREGTLQFREDIYGRDGPLDRALHERPPRPGSNRADPFTSFLWRELSS